MKPKDLLEHLETGDRTMEMLKRPEHSDPLYGMAEEIGRLSNLMAQQAGMANQSVGQMLGVSTGAELRLNAYNAAHSVQNYAGLQQSLQNMQAGGIVYYDEPQVENPFRRMWNR